MSHPTTDPRIPQLPTAPFVCGTGWLLEHKPQSQQQSDNHKSQLQHPRAAWLSSSAWLCAVHLLHNSLEKNSPVTARSRTREQQKGRHGVQNGNTVLTDFTKVITKHGHEPAADDTERRETPRTATSEQHQQLQKSSNIYTNGWKNSGQLSAYMEVF